MNMPSYPNRLAASLPTVDFALMLQEIEKHDYTDEQIAQLLGMHRKEINNIKCDRKEINAWNTCVRLLDIYLKITQKPIPFI
jgi:hypothetical protein